MDHIIDFTAGTNLIDFYELVSKGYLNDFDDIVITNDVDSTYISLSNHDDFLIQLTGDIALTETDFIF